ncbi:MAG: antitoxin VapB family protein [Nanoarchaeota archaeon]
MTIKSLTITEDAYDTLKRLKHGDESFSEVILRVGREKSRPIADFFGILKMSEREAEEMIRRVRDRRNDVDLELKSRQKKFEIIKRKNGGP